MLCDRNTNDIIFVTQYLKVINYIQPRCWLHTPRPPRPTKQMKYSGGTRLQYGPLTEFCTGTLRLKCDGTRAETRFRLSCETDESI